MPGSSRPLREANPGFHTDFKAPPFHAVELRYAKLLNLVLVTEERRGAEARFPVEGEEGGSAHQNRWMPSLDRVERLPTPSISSNFGLKL